MENLPVDIGVLIASAITTLAIILYLREYNLRRKDKFQEEQILEKFREKGLENLHQSIKKSQAILGQAELEGIKVAAETKFETSKLEEEYSRQLSAIINQSEGAITAAQNQLLQFMQDLQKRSGEFEEASKASGQQRINQLFEGLETKLSDFLIQTEQKTTSSIELELKAARQLIDAYKNGQLKLIDENIVAMMEQTLNIVLAKKLSLKDQLDLIYEALEKAKIEKFII